MKTIHLYQDYAPHQQYLHLQYFGTIIVEKIQNRNYARRDFICIFERNSRPIGLVSFCVADFKMIAVTVANNQNNKTTVCCSYQVNRVNS